LTACSGSDNKEEQIPFGLKSEVVTPADHVSDIVFAPDGRMFYAEQLTGAIRVVSATGQPLPEPFAQLDIATWLNLDWGLTGLAVDPNFTSNHYLYAFYTAPAEAAAAPRLQQPAQIPTPSTAGQQPTPSPSPKATASAAASP